MARPRKDSPRQQYIESDEEVIDLRSENVEDATNLQHDIDSQLSSIFSAVGYDERDEIFKIRVYKVTPKTGERSTCFSAVPGEMEGFTERVQSEFGGGLYELWIFRNNKLYKRIDQRILEPRRIDPTTLIRSEMSDVVRVLVDSNRENFQQLRELMLTMQGNSKNIPPPPPQPQINPLEIMQGMASMLATMHGMMPQARESSHNNFDTFIKAAEFVKDLTPRGDAESNVWDGVTTLAKEFLPSLMDMTAKISQAKAGIPPTTQLPTHSPPQHNQNMPQSQTNQGIPPKPTNTHTHTHTHSQQSDDDMLKFMMSAQIQKLVDRAENGSDHTIYGDLILDNWDILPVELAKMIESENAVDELIKINPAVANQRVWFENLVHYINDSSVDVDATEEIDPSPDVKSAAVSNTIDTTKNS